MTKQKLIVISVVALVVCAASALYAASIPATGMDDRPNWDNFGISIWITLLITLPSFAAFTVAAILVIIKTIRK